MSELLICLGIAFLLLISLIAAAVGLLGEECGE